MEKVEQTNINTKKTCKNNLGIYFSTRSIGSQIGYLSLKWCLIMGREECLQI
jgi:hypothetical protein